MKVASSASVLRLYEESAHVFLPNGLPPVPPYQGETGFFRLGRLPTTLKRLAEAGLRDFYTGDVASDVLSDIRDSGGVIDATDLADCRAQVQPASTIANRSAVAKVILVPSDNDTVAAICLAGAAVALLAA